MPYISYHQYTIVAVYPMHMHRDKVISCVIVLIVHTKITRSHVLVANAIKMSKMKKM